MFKKTLLTILATTFTFINGFAYETTSHVMTCNSFERSASVFSRDMDMDGDDDVLATSGNSIYLHETTAPGESVKHLVCHAEDPLSVYASDLDNDGDFDVIVSTADATLTWYENTGSPAFTFSARKIPAAAGPATYLRVADMDQDGDSDILTHSSSDGQIKWYENKGNEYFELHHMPMVSGSRDIIASDFDQDSYVDILACSSNRNGSTLTLYRNAGDFDTAGSANQIISESSQISCLYAADMDKDNDKDILAYLDGNEIAWYKNNGRTFVKQSIRTNLDHIEKIFPEDSDNDGDIDIICQDRFGNMTLLINSGTRSPVFMKGTMKKPSVYAESLVQGH